MIAGQAVLIAIGVDWDGRRQVLGVELANRESRSSWRDFLLGLRERVCKGSESCLRLVPALCVETHENWLEAHRYLNMDYLRELKKEALRKAPEPRLWITLRVPHRRNHIRNQNHSAELDAHNFAFAKGRHVRGFLRGLARGVAGTERRIYPPCQLC